EDHPQDLAPGEALGRRCHEDLRARRRLGGHVVPGDARPAQRAAQQQRRGAGRLRQRLSRGHLRHVRAHDQRAGARARADHDVPAAHEVVQGRRHDHGRAVAGRRLPGAEGPLRRPRRPGPDDPGRRLRVGQHRFGSRRARHAGPEGERRPRLRGGHLHRLRRLCRGLPERVGVAVRGREDHPPRRAPPGPAGAPHAGRRHGRPARRRGLRRLHQHRRVLGGLPAGDPARRDLPAQQGPAQRAPGRRL
ncbi:MAG: Succinate dehydrogenase iron-sulfur protein, partial [uncultured Nocardioidaceae bacterium]